MLGKIIHQDRRLGLDCETRPAPKALTGRVINRHRLISALGAVTACDHLHIYSIPVRLILTINFSCGVYIWVYPVCSRRACILGFIPL